jgi:hypothetical protein
VRLACLRSATRKGRLPETRLEWLGCVLAEMLHPGRSLQVIRAWLSGPGLAARLADAHRPRAQCVLLGHTHLPGCWRRGGKTVINTGSYLPWFGRSLVDISEDFLVVRAVAREGNHFHPGRELARWPLHAVTEPMEEPASEQTDEAALLPVRAFPPKKH